jgi:hypothetical protein
MLAILLAMGVVQVLLFFRMSSKNPTKGGSGDVVVSADIRAAQSACDSLLLEYETSPSAEACEVLEERCKLPCDTGDSVFAPDFVVFWNGVSFVSFVETWTIVHALTYIVAQGKRDERASNLLMYALRSIHTFSASFRRLFIVLPSQQHALLFPSWLTLEHPRIRFVVVDEPLHERVHKATHNDDSGKIVMCFSLFLHCLKLCLQNRH